MPDARPASGNRSNRRRVGFPRPYVCETLESFRVWFGHRKWFAGGPSIAFGAACPLASTCSCISRGSTRRPRLARPCFRCLACSASLSSKWLRGRHGRVECRRIVCFSGRLAAHCPLSGVVAVRRLRRVHWSKEVGSVSKPEELVANHSGTRLLSEGPGPARNFGMRYATSDIIAFIDADCRAHRDWLRNRCLNSTLMRRRSARASQGDVTLLKPERQAGGKSHSKIAIDPNWSQSRVRKPALIESRLSIVTKFRHSMNSPVQAVAVE